MSCELLAKGRSGFYTGMQVAEAAMRLKKCDWRSWLRRPRGVWQWVVAALAATALGVAGLAAWMFVGLPDVAPLKERGASLTIEVPDWQGKLHPFAVGPKNPYWAPLATLPDVLKWAVIVAEDANFYEHGGIDVPAIKEAIRYDLKRKRLAHGASTITQQLAKNLYLSRDRSLRRKLRELVVAQRLEEELTKGRILELYLNVVELGPLVYGVGHGASHHFGKPAAQLTPEEAAFLVAMLPGPRIAYNPQTKGAKVRQRAAHLLRLLGRRGILDETELADALVRLGGLGGGRSVD